MKGLDVTESVVKNEQSARIIPVHPAVIDLLPSKGWNKDDAARLFTYAIKQHTGKASDNASEQLMKHVNKVRRHEKITHFQCIALGITSLRFVGNMKSIQKLRSFMLGHAGSGG